MKRNLLLLIATILLIATTATAQIPTNGLVAYYPFTGNAIDSSGNGNNGTVNGATLTTDRFGKANSAYSFNGTSNYIYVAPISTLTTSANTGITISIWVNANNIISGDLFDLRSTNNASLDLRFDTTGNIYPRSMHISSYSPSPNYDYGPSSKQITPTNKWYHYVITQDNTSKIISLYVNGQLDTALSMPITLLTTPKFNIGSRYDFNNSRCCYYSGSLDDIRIYNRALSSTEVTALYNENGYSSSLNFNQSWLTLIDSAATTTSEAYDEDAGSFMNPISQKLTLSNDGKTIGAVGTSNSDITIKSLNTANGNTKFQYTYTNSGIDAGRAIQIDNNGYFHTLGVLNLGVDNSQRDLVSKIDSNGNAIFNHIITTTDTREEGNTMEINKRTGISYSYSMNWTGSANLSKLNIVDNSGNSLATNIITDYDWYEGWAGRMTKDGLGNYIFNGKHQTTVPYYGIVVRKIDSVGNTIWSTLYNQHTSQLTETLKCDSVGNVFMTYQGQGGYLISGIAKFDKSTGALIWDNAINPTKDGVHNLSVLSSGNVVVNIDTGTINCYNGQNGTLLWNSNGLKNSLPFSIDANDNIYQISGDSIMIFSSGGNVLYKSIVTIPGQSIDLRYVLADNMNGLFYIGGNATIGSVSKMFIAKYASVITPIINFNPLQDTVRACGDSVVLDAGAGFAAYSWSNGATTQSLTVKQSGNYKVTVTNATGATASDSSYVSIVKANILNKDTTICKGSSITLSIDSLFAGSNITTKAQLPANLQNGLVAFYPFNGNANDASGNGNNGTEQTINYTLDRFGIPNSCVNFPKSNTTSQIDLGTNINPAKFSLSFWINQTNTKTNAFNVPISKYNNNQGFEIQTGNGTGYTLPNGTSWQGIGDTSKLNLNKWYHLVATFDGNYAKLFINGTQKRCILAPAQTTYVDSMYQPNYSSGSNHLLIGNRPIDVAYNFHYEGNIDDIIIYNRALTTAEVKQLYVAKPKVTWSTGDSSNSITVKPVVTTTYYVTVTDGVTTCKDSVKVTVSDMSGYNALLDTVRACGDSVVLNAGAGYAAYSWSNGATTQSITVKQSGWYKVTVTNASGCTGVDSSYVSIVKAKILTASSTICKGSSITLSIDSLFAGSNITTKAQLPTNLQNGLVAFYPFNGNANDLSGNGNNGTVNGATLTTDRFGNAGGAYSFSQSTNIIKATVNNNNLLTSNINGLTYSVWVNFSTFPTSSPSAIMSLWSKNTDSAYGTYYDQTKGVLVADCGRSGYAGTMYIYGLNTPIINSWYNLTLTSDFINNVSKLYINGVFQSQTTGGLIRPNITQINLGQWNVAGTWPLNGKLDDISIFNRALSPYEVQQLYTAKPKVTWSTGDSSNSITVKPGVTTTYYVTVTDGVTTCKDSVKVTVSDMSGYNALVDTIRACGDSVVLNAGTGYAAYSWSNGATTQTITVKQSGSYKVTVTNASGCTGVDSSYVSIVKANIINKDTTICKGSSITLSIDSSIVGVGSVNSKAQLPANLQNGLVAFYPFNGNANDASGNGNNLTNNGGVIYGNDRFGNINSSPIFNGINQTLSKSSANIFTGNSDRTMSCWINQTTNSSTVALININDGVSTGTCYTSSSLQSYATNDGYFFWGRCNDKGWSSSRISNNWYNLIVTYTLGNVSLYVNGKLLSTQSISSLNTNPAQLIIGGGMTDNNNNGFWNGKIDDVGLWNRVLSATEIQQLYNSKPKVTWSTGDSSNSIIVSPTKTTTYYITITDGVTVCKDSVKVTVNQPTTSTINKTACTSYLWHGVNYTKSGVYTFDSLNKAGCDSLTTLNLTINQPSVSSTNLTIYSNQLPFSWNGLTFNAAGSQTAHILNVGGCDSAATLNLTVVASQPKTLFVSQLNVCNGGTVTVPIYMKNIKRVTGFQGSINFDKAILRYSSITGGIGNISPSTADTANGRIGFMWVDPLLAGQSYADSTIAFSVKFTVAPNYIGKTVLSFGTLPTALEIDTVAAGTGLAHATTDTAFKGGYVNFTGRTNGSSNSATVCPSSLPYKWNGLTFNASGTQTAHLTNTTGCDSAATMVLTVKPNATTNTVNVSGCNSVVYKGKTYTASTTVRDTVKSAMGCDSIYNVGNIKVTTIIPATNYVPLSACNKLVYKGITYYNSGVATDTVKSYQGCDSVYNILLITINTITTKTNTSSISGCNSVIFRSVNYTSSTSITDTVKSYQGCDSVYNVTTININKIIPTNKQTTLSGCNSVTYKGNTYYSTSIVKDTTKSYQGCDSVYTLATIIVTKITPTSNTVNLNSCDSVVYKTIVYKSSTTFNDTIKSIGGCDSIYNAVTIVINNLSVNGGVYHPLKGYVIPNVTAIMSGSNNSNTIGTGNYGFGCLPIASNETIRLYKNNDVNKANGVTTLDIALVQSHILQKSSLNSPLKVIAADVNGDGKVSTLDIVYMKRLILGIDTTFTNSTTKQNRLWAFVDSSYKFIDASNPFPYKDSINFVGLNSNQINQSFIGQKLGDVDWSWNPAVAKPMINELNAVELSYTYPSDALPGRTDGLQATDEVRIPIKVKNFKELIGLQYTLNFNAAALKFVGINNKSLDVEIGTNHADEGKVTFLWVDAKNEVKTLEDGSVLFELVFEKTGKEAIGKEAIVNTLSVDGSVTALVAYDKDYQSHDVVLKKMETIPSLQQESWVVAPNPTKDGVIQVQMNLKDKKIIVFRLLDNSGRLLLTKQVEGVKGSNYFTLREGNIASGTYYLQAVGVEGVKQLRIEN